MNSAKRSLIAPPKASSDDPASRLRQDVLLLRRTTAAALAATLLLSPRLWLTTRDYPPVALWDGLAQPSYPCDYVIWVTMLCALGTLAILPRARWSLWPVLAIALVWALLDQSRWHRSEGRGVPRKNHGHPSSVDFFTA